MRKFITPAAVATIGLAALPAQAANVIPAHWSSISRPIGEGTLRAGSPWGPGSTPSSAVSIVDGTFAPTGQQWNNGSLWWDQTVTVSPFQITLVLDSAFTFNRLVVQADDNDDYLVEYWNGAAWQSVFTAAAVFTFGLETRDSGIISSFTTDRFRLSAANGDQYYAISEFQAFTPDVPEPATWAMLMLGFGAIGGALRRRPKVRVAFA